MSISKLRIKTDDEANNYGDQTYIMYGFALPWSNYNDALRDANSIPLFIDPKAMLTIKDNKIAGTNVIDANINGDELTVVTKCSYKKIDQYNYILFHGLYENNWQFKRCRWWFIGFQIFDSGKLMKIPRLFDFNAINEKALTYKIRELTIHADVRIDTDAFSEEKLEIRSNNKAIINSSQTIKNLNIYTESGGTKIEFDAEKIYAHITSGYLLYNGKNLTLVRKAKMDLISANFHTDCNFNRLKIRSRGHAKISFGFVFELLELDSNGSIDITGTLSENAAFCRYIHGNSVINIKKV